ncbi:hypothetical protein IEO21_10642 [Rhodonia placenta]|uniref:Uncharacterized protein n=1 Tax=Rhodonia placenta TaxID=104341 RepID=A0A8H7TX42_9APHY|nr:hypothetical protein IEO21_10642 [Postia placenta]
MDQLIGERARIGIHNAADLGCYYRDFMAITKHLIAQNRLSTIEQTLLTRLETRLHLKHPDHYADDPYTMAEIHAAATFILHGTSSTPTTAANQPIASTSNTSTTVPPGMIKTEDISMIIESLSRTITTLIQPTTHAMHNHTPAPKQQAAVHVHENSGAEQTCHYCGNRGCRVGTCEFAEIDIQDGKRNPAAPAAPTMLFEIDDCSTVQTFTLNTSGRIEALERELLQLRKRKEVFDSVEILQRKKPTTTAVPKSAEASGSGTSKGVAAPSSTSTSTAPPPTIPAASPVPPSSPPTQSASQPTTTSAPPAPPVHPFANARDATYAPPNVRNFATPPKPSNDKGKEPAYKTIVPVIQPKLAEEIFQRSMKSQFVTLTPEELLSIAPDVRTKYRDAVTPKRVSTEPVASAHIVEIGADEVMAVNQLSCSGATLEPGATIVPDPYETYLKHIPHGEHPAEFTVARDSNAIRSIIALIDNKEQIECIVDPGSQIVAMSEEISEHAIGERRGGPIVGTHSKCSLPHR